MSIYSYFHFSTEISIKVEIRMTLNILTIITIIFFTQNVPANSYLKYKYFFFTHFYTVDKQILMNQSVWNKRLFLTICADYRKKGSSTISFYKMYIVFNYFIQWILFIVKCLIFKSIFKQVVKKLFSFLKFW